MIQHTDISHVGLNWSETSFINVNHITTYSESCQLVKKMIIGYSHSKQGATKMCCVVEQSPSHNEPCCVYGDDGFEGLHKPVTATLHMIVINTESATSILCLTMHSDMRTYTFTHTHWTLSDLLMHRFTSLPCSENSTGTSTARKR